MIHPLDYCFYVIDAKDNRKIMARIALNLFHDKSEFPVDLSEINRLYSKNRIMTYAAMMGKIKEDHWLMDDETLAEIKKVYDNG